MITNTHQFGIKQEQDKLQYNKQSMSVTNELLTDKEKHVFEAKKRKFYLYTAFLYLLSEIAIENKEKSVLLYKIFKSYYAEIETKWVKGMTKKLTEKIEYYREFCMRIIAMKSTDISSIEKIQDVMLSHKLTKESLEAHKHIIAQLLNEINSKKEQIYLFTSENEILKKELRFFLWDYESLKLSKEFRENMKNIQINKIIETIQSELGERKVYKFEMAGLVNSERLITASGQKTHFLDQKMYYLKEIEKLNITQKDLYEERNIWREKYNMLKMESELHIQRITNELSKYREVEIKVYNYAGTQTDIDNLEFNKMLMNHNAIISERRLTENKLTRFIERINYNVTSAQPMSKRALLEFITEIYNEKIMSDHRKENENKRKLNLDEFFYYYMKNKHKLVELIEKNCEEGIMSILKYSSRFRLLILLYH